MDAREVTNTVEVPRNTGVDGFLLTLRELLRKPRLQEIRIDSRGKVTYKRVVIDDEQDVVNIDFETVSPASIIRNADVEELVFPAHTPAAIVLGRVFDRMAIDRLYPVAFVTGAATVFWDWYRVTTRSTLNSTDHAFGLPVIRDRHVPDTALILCGAMLRESSLIDTRKALKIEMETSILKPPETTVEVL